jgi:rSAM/selenodomain-associated transferase 1
VTRDLRQVRESRGTIVIFAREPIAGTTKTRLIRRIGAKNAAALAEAFMLDALAKAGGCGLRVVIAGSARHGVTRSAYFRKLARDFATPLYDQRNGTLGARMCRALAPFQHSGAILIGTDTPTLPGTMLTRAAGLLRRYPVVLGPSLDGGYYLIGLRGETPDIFRGIRWGRGEVLARTIDRLHAANIRYALNPTWYDVDRWSDLLLLSAHLRLLARAQPHPCPATAQVLRSLGLLAGRG